MKKNSNNNNNNNKNNKKPMYFNHLTVMSYRIHSISSNNKRDTRSKMTPPLFFKSNRRDSSSWQSQQREWTPLAAGNVMQCRRLESRMFLKICLWMISHFLLQETSELDHINSLCEKYFQHRQDLYHVFIDFKKACLLYTSPSPRDMTISRMPSSA